MSAAKTFADAWAWDPPYIRFMIGWVGIFGSLLSMIGFAIMGNMFWTFGWMPLLGFMFGTMYHFVGKKVRSLHTKTSAQFPTGECVESMMSFKGVECPGIAVLEEQNLLLVPMVEVLLWLLLKMN